ncbi:MAG: hypothetical protein R3A78_10755 [Polyangiales bacterium]
MIDIHHGDNLEVLRTLPRECFDLVYIDPPFNSGRAQTRTKLKTVRDEDGDRTGFKGQRYRTVRLGSQSFGDRFDDFLAFLEPRLEEIVPRCDPRRAPLRAPRRARCTTWRYRRDARA